MADTSTSWKAVERAAAYMERVVEVRYFALFMSFLLALDSAMALFHGNNVLTFWTAEELDEVLIGQALVFMVVYSFLMSLFLPALWAICAFFVRRSGIGSLVKARPKSRVYKSATLIKKEALEARDTFDLERVQVHVEQQRQDFRDAIVWFSLMVLLVFNTFAFDAISISNSAYAYWQHIDGLLAKVLLGCMFGVFFIALSLGVLQSLLPVYNDQLYLPRKGDYKIKIEDSDLMPFTTCATPDDALEADNQCGRS